MKLLPLTLIIFTAGCVSLPDWQRISAQTLAVSHSNTISLSYSFDW